MATQFDLRPPLEEMSLFVFRRSLHPELFERLAVRRIQQVAGSLELWLTTSGHVISWRGSAGNLTEVAAAGEELPTQGRLLQHRLHGQRSLLVGRPPRGQYQVSFQVEQLPPEIFLDFQQEIRSSRDAFVFVEQTNHRLRLSPVRAILFESRPNCITWFAFHTFPDDHAIIKTQSLLEF